MKILLPSKVHSLPQLQYQNLRFAFRSFAQAFSLTLPKFNPLEPHQLQCHRLTHPSCYHPESQEFPLREVSGSIDATGLAR